MRYCAQRNSFSVPTPLETREIKADQMIQFTRTAVDLLCRGKNRSSYSEVIQGIVSANWLLGSDQKWDHTETCSWDCLSLRNSKIIPQWYGLLQTEFPLTFLAFSVFCLYPFVLVFLPSGNTSLSNLCVPHWVWGASVVNSLILFIVKLWYYPSVRLKHFIPVEESSIRQSTKKY